ncbi:unnamed protein product [Cercospora beticola]|nr:unnamed protein product [Cercospora beticola]
MKFTIILALLASIVHAQVEERYAIGCASGCNEESCHRCWQGIWFSTGVCCTSINDEGKCVRGCP